MRTIPLLLALFAGPALAHDLWIEKEGNTYVLLQGHRHSAHEGAELVPYDAGAVKGILCLDGRGSSKPLPVGKSAPARVSGDCAGLFSTFSTGYWTKTAWETRNVPKTGISGVIKSWYSEESLKYVERWTAIAAAPLGNGLEITPTVNPLTLKAGDKLVVQITDGGKPVAGVPVAYAGDTRGASGPDGKVAIRLRHGGLQLLEASQETPLTDGKADTSIRTTSLQFEIAP
jgi:nickel transport protein